MAAEPELLFLRDLADVEPPRERYAHYEDEDIYKLVPRPQWTGLEDEIWTPRSQEHDPQLEKVKALMKRNSSGSGGEQSPAMNAFSATKFTTKLARKKRKNPRVKVRQFLNHRLCEGFVNLAILWALFTEDIRVLSLPKSWDIAIWSIHVLIMFCFLVEHGLRSYAQRGYFKSFYFYLDVVATATMLGDFWPLFSLADQGKVALNASAFRAAKAARVGTRVARLMRVIRIIRVLKLFISVKKSREGKEEEVEKPSDDFAPSELGKALQARISKRTIIFILVLLFASVGIEFIPYSGVAVTDLSDDRVPIAMAQLYETVNFSATAMDEPFLSMRKQFRTIVEAPLTLDSIWPSCQLPLFFLKVYDYPTAGQNTSFWPLPSEGGTEAGQYKPASYYATAGDDTDPMRTWTYRWPDSDPAWPNCLYSNFALLAPDSGNSRHCPNAQGSQRPMRELRTASPTELTREFYAIEGKIKMEAWYSRKYAEDITAGFSIILTLLIAALLGLMAYLFSKDLDSLVIRPIESMVDSITKLAANPAYKMEKIEKVRYETDALKLSLAKIAAMLQVGFGEAGNNLVAENLKKGDTVDPMVPGRKLLGAYGFCIIDEYEEVLECLGEEILPFTNTAASIVHDAVTDNGGQPNRNLGEAFLCVWKPQLDHDPSPDALAKAESKMCDGAITAFRRCVRHISMSAQLQAYNHHEEILKFFDGHYTTRIGYGLNYGWAIEGAVGTNIKIDCSYLSPHVNLAARLESATKMYGVNILMSEEFVGKLSATIRAGLRCVDVVCLKGSSIPMEIYTCDRSNALYVAPAAIAAHGDGVIAEFQRLFKCGMDDFVRGDWHAARKSLDLAQAICPRDKPSQRILWHMDTPEAQPDYGLAATAFNAPEGWPGYHILLSK